MANQSRSYVVNVTEYSSGDIVEYKSFPVESSNPLKAKGDALKEAKSFAKQYSDDGNVFLFVMVLVEDEELLYLDRDGNEDTLPIDWLDVYNK